MDRNAKPVFDCDFWSDEVILDPYPIYEQMRRLGPAVWLPRHECWAITRFDALKGALLNPEVFSSAHGCMMNEPMNVGTQGIMLCMDDPDHLALRRIFARPLQPKALKDQRARLEELARAKVDWLLGQARFDAVRDLAHFLPLTVVTELVGLDEEGRANMLEWAAGIFNAFGPEGNARTIAGIEIALMVIDYALNRVQRANLLPGSWGAALFEAADAGTISEQTARLMLVDYLSPALDTTINATSAAIELFAANPDQWDLLRTSPELVGDAINEVVRIESPVRAFSRYVTRDVVLGEARMKAGDRALMLYACANRDPLHYVWPDRFDITRKCADHLGFGQGTHVCAGMHLAKLEITVLLEALLPRVERFIVHKSERRAHNTLRGLHYLETSLVAG
jgi:cytochrome P450